MPVSVSFGMIVQMNVNGQYPRPLLPAQWSFRRTEVSLSQARASYSNALLLHTVLLQDGGLGVHLTLDMGGQARFGPDVEWIPSIDYTVSVGQSLQHAAIESILQSCLLTGVAYQPVKKIEAVFAAWECTPVQCNVDHTVPLRCCHCKPSLSCSHEGKYSGFCTC